MKEYEQIDNVRPNQPTPFVVLVFESPPNSNLIVERFESILASDKTFDLTQFMIDYELDDGE